jgi:hypothetical protein
MTDDQLAVAELAAIVREELRHAELACGCCGAAVDETVRPAQVVEGEPWCSQCAGAPGEEGIVRGRWGWDRPIPVGLTLRAVLACGGVDVPRGRRPGSPRTSWGTGAGGPRS